MQHFFSFFIAIIKDISFIDIADIALVSYGIYMILLFIEGTRAFNLLKGLGIIVILLVITKNLDFNTVSWLLANVLPTGVLALVVIFQPELRRALEDLGKGQFFGEQTARSEAAIETVREEICKTIENCAKKRVGALIVIEHGIGLKDFMRNGIMIDSNITSELMEAIFKPFSTLHDGAVIIQGTRLAAAGCFLPTASNHNEVAKELGSRHRAAIGITEITDAIVFVVSEETGKISMAKSGKLTRDLSPERVKELVTSSLIRSEIYLKKSNRAETQIKPEAAA